MKQALLILTCLSFLACKKIKTENQPFNDYQARTNLSLAFEEFPIQGTTIRAIQVLNDSTVWFAGSGGNFGYTQDNGKSWHRDVEEYQGKKLEFRSLKVQPNGDVFLVGVADPAVVLKSTDNGISWNVVYEDLTPNAFFDAIEFWDEKHGMLLGDPVNGCFHIALTNDGGDTWNRVDCSVLPPALANEAPFAASNTNIAVMNNRGWFATGGMSESRVYYSTDKGLTWNVSSTPIVSGKQMTGIYSIDFIDEMNGVVVGGNWDKVNENWQNIAVTSDGGMSWNVVADSANLGYHSCVKFIPGTRGKELLATHARASNGPNGISYSNDRGITWQSLENRGLITVRFANRNLAWLAGKNKIARLTITP
jgi:photosystem II stability/assembly factor-like uncharacterized protein